MDEEAKAIIEKICSIIKAQPELLDDGNEDLCVSVVYQQTKADFDSFYESGELRSVTPTNPAVKEIYFANLDTSTFTNEDFEAATNDLRVTLEVWEDNRSTYAD
jgi:hypothetical protein